MTTDPESEHEPPISDAQLPLDPQPVLDEQPSLEAQPGLGAQPILDAQPSSVAPSDLDTEPSPDPMTGVSSTGQLQPIGSGKEDDPDNEMSLFIDQDEPDNVNTVPEDMDGLDTLMGGVVDHFLRQQQQIEATTSTPQNAPVANMLQLQEDATSQDTTVPVNDPEPIERPSSPKIKIEKPETSTRSKQINCTEYDICGDGIVLTGRWTKERQAKFDPIIIQDQIVDLENDNETSRLSHNAAADSRHDGGRSINRTHSIGKGERRGGAKVKEEYVEKAYPHTIADDGHIVIDDSGDEIERTDRSGGGSRPNIKQEKGFEEADWGFKDGETIDLEKFSLFGDRQAQRHILDSGTTRQAQERFLARIRQRNGPSGQRAGAGNIFHVQQRISQLQSQPRFESDGLEEVPAEIIEDDPDPTIAFNQLKDVYNAKKRSRKTTLEDDVVYKKAKRAHQEHLNKLAHDAADSGDEAEESDDGYRVPQSAYTTGSMRQAFARYVERDEDEDLVDLLNVDLGHTISQPVEKSTSDPEEKKRNKEYKTDVKKEHGYNLLAGIEHILFKEQLKQELQATKIVEKEQEAGKKKGKKGKTKASRTSNVSSLLTSDAFRDSNANIGKRMQPVITSKKKQDFLTSLVASIPPEVEKQGKADVNDLRRASVRLGKGKCVPDGAGNWAFRGLSSSLYNYQVIGSAAMKDRELGEKAPYGGILADEMGLGKTIQTIAAIIANRQTDTNRSKCTLIVCTPALIGQWEKELNTHANANAFALITRHHSGTRFQGKGAADAMEKYDIILTTYGEVLKSYPTRVTTKEFEEMEDGETWWLNFWEKNRGLLHRAYFHRVVLDEAHCIKNHLSQTSIACRALMSKHRWAITGTPISNRLEEFFPYFKFLRVAHTGSMNIFKHNFCLPNNTACQKRLVSVVAGMMIRRTHQDKVCGFPLIELPKNTQTTIKLRFTDVERLVYERIRLRCIRAINTVAKDAQLDQKVTLIIMMMQRLRQMVSHILMVQEVIEKEYDKDKVEWLDDIAVAMGSDETIEKALAESLKDILDERDVTRQWEKDHPEYESQDEAESGPTQKKQKAKGLTVAFGRILRNLKKTSQWAEHREKSLCATCGVTPEDPYVTSCYHLYCHDCLTNLSIDAGGRDKDHAECAKCEKVFKKSESCAGLRELESLRDMSATCFQQNSNDKAPIKKKFKLSMKHVDKDNKLVLSTKLVAVKKQIEDWIRQDPNVKIIVFSDWLMTMHLVGRLCQQQKWKSFQYNGKLSREQRERVIEEFSRDESGVKILVASLKCGGTGLNLTAASRVICIDLWYNKCVETQAFCRVHRIGQLKETFCTRFVIEDTVDERLVDMQNKKKKLVDGAINSRMDLSVEELLSLFGDVGHDSNNNPFILVDDDAAQKKGKKAGAQAGRSRS